MARKVIFLFYPQALFQQPEDWNPDDNIVEIIGSGGDGGANFLTATRNAGGGGGGGGYAKGVNVKPVFPVSLVWAGTDTQFGGVVAAGNGASTAASTPGAAGSSGYPAGFYGGAGGAGTSQAGYGKAGAGGGAAGPNGAGGAGSSGAQGSGSGPADGGTILGWGDNNWFGSDGVTAMRWIADGIHAGPSTGGHGGWDPGGLHGTGGGSGRAVGTHAYDLGFGGGGGGSSGDDSNPNKVFPGGLGGLGIIVVSYGTGGAEAQAMAMTVG